jgi:hypothetical protein
MRTSVSRLSRFFLFSFFVAACGGSSGASIPASSDDGTDPSQSAPAGSSTAAPPGGGGSGAGQKAGNPPPPPPGDHAPSIASVTLTPTAMGPGVTVTIDAVVTDPDGDADIAGGTLYPKGASTGAIATFARAKSAGHFTATADGVAFDAAAPLTLAPGESVNRDFTVRFVDREGAPAAKDVTLAFEGGTSGICRGASVASFWRDCTSCSVSCPSGTECAGNACASRLDCGFASFSCSSRCMDAGKTCIGSYAVTYVSSDDLSAAMDQCGAATRPSYGFGAASCAATTAGNAVRGCYCK